MGLADGGEEIRVAKMGAEEARWRAPSSPAGEVVRTAEAGEELLGVIPTLRVPGIPDNVATEKGRSGCGRVVLHLVAGSATWQTGAGGYATRRRRQSAFTT